MAKKPAQAADDATPMLSLIETPNLPAPTVLDQARVVLLDTEQADQFYAKIKAETDKHVADVTTAKGRDAVRSLARRVTTTATSLHKSALELTAGLREQVKAVNDARDPMVERIKALAAEVRKPLTDYETAELARVGANDAVIAKIRADGVVREDDTSVTVAERGKLVWALTFDGPQWTPEEAARATDAKDAAVAALLAARNRLAKEEADAAELEALRAEKAERDEADRVAAAEREEAARVEREAEKARQRQAEWVEAERVRVENERIAEEQRVEAERQRVERAAAEAREDAKRQADAEAQAERDRVREAHDAEIAAERKKAAEAEAARLAEADRVAKEREDEKRERDRLAKIAADQAAEDARRARNRAHVAQVMTAAKEAIMTTGVTEEQARAIVVAIKAGLVPAVGIAF